MGQVVDLGQLLQCCRPDRNRAQRQRTVRLVQHGINAFQALMVLRVMTRASMGQECVIADDAGRFPWEYGSGPTFFACLLLEILDRNGQNRASGSAQQSLRCGTGHPLSEGASITSPHQQQIGCTGVDQGGHFVNRIAEGQVDIRLQRAAALFRDHRRQAIAPVRLQSPLGFIIRNLISRIGVDIQGRFQG